MFQSCFLVCNVVDTCMSHPFSKFRALCWQSVMGFASCMCHDARLPSSTAWGAAASIGLALLHSDTWLCHVVNTNLCPERVISCSILFLSGFCFCIGANLSLGRVVTMFACILLFRSEHVFYCNCETAGVRVVDVVSVYTFKASMCVLPQDVFHKPCVSTSMLSAKTFYLKTWFPQLA